MIGSSVRKNYISSEHCLNGTGNVCVFNLGTNTFGLSITNLYMRVSKMLVIIYFHAA